MTESAPDQPTPESLRTTKCEPCEGGVSALDRDAVERYLIATPHWTVNEQATVISRKINRRNFVEVIELVNRIAEIAEAEQHHPDLHVTGYRHLTIEITTHAIGGLSANDFILAAKIDHLVSEKAK